MSVEKKLILTFLILSIALTGNAYGLENNTLRWGVSNVAFQKGSNKNDRPVITGISVHSNESVCSVVGDDHLVRIYSTADQKVLQTLEGHKDWVRCSKFTPSGELISGGNDRRILIWKKNEAGKFQFSVLTKEDRATAALDISPNGRYLATVGFSDDIFVYDIKSGQRVMKMKASSKDMRAVKFSPTDQTLAVAGRDGIIRTFHLDTGKSIRDYQPHKRRVRGLAFSKDGKKLLSVGEDRVVAVTTLSKVIRPTVSTQLDYKLMSLAVIDDDRFAIGGADNLVQIWNIADLSKVGNLVGHTGTIAALDSFRGELVSGGYDTRLRVWRTAPSVAQQNSKIQ